MGGGGHWTRRYDFKSWKSPLANLIHLVWDAWQFCRSLSSDTVTKEIFKGEETLLILIIHLESQTIVNEIQMLSGNCVLKERKRRKDTELSFVAPKENVSRFTVVPYALKRSVHLDSARSDTPNNTQCPAQTFSYLVLSKGIDPSFLHFHLSRSTRQKAI